MRAFFKSALGASRAAARGLACFLRAASTRLWTVLRSPALRRVLRPLRRLVLGAVAGGLAAFVLVCGLNLGFQRVPPGNVGVRQVNSGEAMGIEARDYAPGIHFGPRFLNRWHLVDTRVQALYFAWESEGGRQPVLALRTPEGISVSVAAAVPYRILPGHANRIVAEGLKESYRLRVRTTAEAVLTTELARLGAEEWADTDARQAARAATLEVLRERLEPEHVEPLDLLLHGVYFPGTYEKKMQEKQLAAQSRRTAEALARREEQQVALRRAELALAEEKARLAHEASRALDALRIAREAEIVAVESETLAYAARRKAQADAEHTKLVAQGERALSEARSLRDELRAAILESATGRRYQASLAAKALRFSSITLDPSDPRLPFVLDIEGLASVLTAGD